VVQHSLKKIIINSSKLLMVYNVIELEELARRERESDFLIGSLLDMVLFEV